MTIRQFYKSNQWQEFREIFIDKELEEKGELICERCKKHIYEKSDCVLHHIVPLNESNVNDPSISVNFDNIELLHKSCHNIKHEKGYRFYGFKSERKSTLVFGPPLAGKREWVRRNAGDNDLIISVDEIYNAISTTRSPRLLRTVLDIRNMLYQKEEEAGGAWAHCWIIATIPEKGEREKYKNRFDCDTVFINTSKENCLIKADELEKKTGKNQDKIREIIENWFNEFEPD